MIAAKFTIDPEFKALIPPLRPEERDGLERDIIERGCRKALDVWAEEGILLDGHNRYEICEAHDIPYDIDEISLPSRSHARLWMIRNQKDRRNITDDQRAAYAVLEKEELSAIAKAERARKAGQTGGKGRPKTDSLETTSASKLSAPARERSRAQAAKSAGVSERRLRNAEQIKKSDPDMFEKVVSGDVTIPQARRDIRKRETVKQLEEVAAREVEAPTGEYDVIVIDPPWPMQKIERDVTPEQVAFEYPTMSLDDIAGMTLPCSGDCHVFVWTTQKFLPATFDILKAWNLKYVFTMVWHKPGGFQPFNLPQYNCEFVLYGRRGSPSFTETKAFPTCFEAPRGSHSEKPEEFYDLLRRVTGGRRVDMFNRRKIDGFVGWGNEACTDDSASGLTNS